MPLDLPVFLPGQYPLSPKVPLSVLVDHLYRFFCFIPYEATLCWPSRYMSIPLFACSRLLRTTPLWAPARFYGHVSRTQGGGSWGAFTLSFIAAPTLVNTVTSCLCFRALPALDSDEVEHVLLPSCLLPWSCFHKVEMHFRKKKLLFRMSTDRAGEDKRWHWFVGEVQKNWVLN